MSISCLAGRDERGLCDKTTGLSEAAEDNIASSGDNIAIFDVCIDKIYTSLNCFEKLGKKEMKRARVKRSEEPRLK